MGTLKACCSYLLLSCLHGIAIGLIVGIAAALMGGNFCAWFGWTAVIDAGGVALNGLINE